MSGMAPEMTEQRARRPRMPVIDIVRGVAIIAMMAYHLCWDLWYFGFITADVGFDPRWVFFARSILLAFIFLAGVGLVLGHGEGIRWQPFWRRWLLVAGGAVLITIGTYVTFPDSFVYFGVLHAIALFSLLGLPFLFTPLWATGLAALALILPPLFFVHSAFNQKALSWLGFWDVPPPANDLVPVFPWFGVALLGILAARLAKKMGLFERLATMQPHNLPARILGFMGRWSLVIYLVHQPILLGIIAPLAGVTGVQQQSQEVQFLSSCQATCEATDTTAALCATYCQCGLEGIKRDDLWEPVFTGLISAGDQAKLEANNRQCSALIYPELDTPNPQ